MLAGVPSRRVVVLPSRRLASLFSLCTVIVLLALSCVATPAAMSATLGGGSALSELTEGQPETTPTQTTATTASTESSSNSNSGTILLLAGAAAAALLIGIAYVIVRDARRVAPAGDGLLGKGGSGHDTATMMRKRRAKAKAARRQRKQNIKRRK
jgi:hypothetical protein